MTCCWISPDTLSQLGQLISVEEIFILRCSLLSLCRLWLLLLFLIQVGYVLFEVDFYLLHSCWCLECVYQPATLKCAWHYRRVGPVLRPYPFPLSKTLFERLLLFKLLSLDELHGLFLFAFVLLQGPLLVLIWYLWNFLSVEYSQLHRVLELLAFTEFS